MKKTNKIVWLSGAMMDASLNKFVIPDVFEQDRKTALDTIKRNTLGENLPDESFPKEAYGIYPDSELEPLPEICNLRGFWTLSAACIEVMSQFDLGRSKFRPLRIFQHDRSTLLQGEYFTINFAETKSSFLSDKSNAREAYPNNADSNLWLLNYNSEQDAIALDPSSLLGPDLWIEENFIKAFFMSDRLVRALNDANLTGRFSLNRCRVFEKGVGLSS